MRRVAARVFNYNRESNEPFPYEMNLLVEILAGK